jgi:hypothetical protein
MAALRALNEIGEHAKKMGIFYTMVYPNITNGMDNVCRYTSRWKDPVIDLLVNDTNRRFLMKSEGNGIVSQEVAYFLMYPEQPSYNLEFFNMRRAIKNFCEYMTNTIASFTAEI